MDWTDKRLVAAFCDVRSISRGYLRFSSGFVYKPCRRWDAPSFYFGLRRRVTGRVRADISRVRQSFLVAPFRTFTNRSPLAFHNKLGADWVTAQRDRK